MQIAVISDTHLKRPEQWFVDFYEQELIQADLLVHCGDLTDPLIWQFLLQHPQFVCARGNCDRSPVFNDSLNDFVKLELSGQQAFGNAHAKSFSLAVCHGWGVRSAVPQTVAEHFGKNWDLICFGHTHLRYFSNEFGSYLCNPGSLGEHGSWAMITALPETELLCEFRSCVSFSQR